MILKDLVESAMFRKEVSIRAIIIEYESESNKEINK